MIAVNLPEAGKLLLLQNQCNLSKGAQIQAMQYFSRQALLPKYQSEIYQFILKCEILVIVQASCIRKDLIWKFKARIGKTISLLPPTKVGLGLTCDHLQHLEDL